MGVLNHCEVVSQLVLVGRGLYDKKKASHVVIYFNIASLVIIYLEKVPLVSPVRPVGESGCVSFSIAGVCRITEAWFGLEVECVTTLI